MFNLMMEYMPDSTLSDELQKHGGRINEPLIGWIDLVDKEGNTEPIGRTPLFMVPEVARGEEQGCPTDIWGLRCTIIEMATGGSPWTNVTNPNSLLYQIAFSGKSPEIPKLLSSQEKDFLKKCFGKDAKEIWTAKELLKHPFLKELGI
ncbi:hypothetical protein KY285_036357 [Solanum tuberosum]|nr:hypothetical protein KY285_036357 [Solanum tuberosum]